MSSKRNGVVGNNVNRFAGRKKPDEDRFSTLKAWVHWATLNPLDDDQALMAKDVNDLFALLGTREAELAAAREDAEVPLAEAVKIINEVQGLLRMFTTNSSEIFKPIKEAYNKNAKFLSDNSELQNAYLTAWHGGGGK